MGCAVQGPFVVRFPVLVGVPGLGTPTTRPTVVRRVGERREEDERERGEKDTRQRVWEVARVGAGTLRYATAESFQIRKKVTENKPSAIMKTDNDPVKGFPISGKADPEWTFALNKSSWKTGSNQIIIFLSALASRIPHVEVL